MEVAGGLVGTIPEFRLEGQRSQLVSSVPIRMHPFVDYISAQLEVHLMQGQFRPEMVHLNICTSTPFDLLDELQRMRVVLEPKEERENITRRRLPLILPAGRCELGQPLMGLEEEMLTV